MFLALIFGIIAGIAMVIYQGIYMGPWDAVLHTMGMAVVGAVLIYIALHFIFSICVQGHETPPFQSCYGVSGYASV